MMSEASAARSPETTLDMRIRKLALSTRVYLVMSKLQAAAQPDVLYDVYVVPSEKAGGKSSARHRVGTINFFNAVNHSEDAESFVNDERFVSFDVTSLVRRLQLEGRLKAQLSVAIGPAGEPATDARPVIGSIELSVQ